MQKFAAGDTVRIKASGKTGAVIDVEQGAVLRYIVLVDGRKRGMYEEQLEAADLSAESEFYTARDVNSLLTAHLLMNPNINSLYSLNSSRIDFIPYQFRPVLKLIKSESPRILIADGVGVGKTIEAGLILKELEARLDIKSVLVICPKPLISESKWKRELKEKFGENFMHLDGEKFRYCIKESDLDGEWPEQYSKCIIPYSLFDEAAVAGTKDGIRIPGNRKCMADLKPFPKFDLVIVDEAHHIKNDKTWSHRAVRMFCDSATSIVMLTATPIQLGDRDLFTLLQLLRPDVIYDYDSFEKMSEPNPFINEAAKIIRGNDGSWQSHAEENLVKAGLTSWGRQVLLPNPAYMNALKVLRQKEVSAEERVKLITDVESLHTFARIINRTRRRDIGAFTVRKPETLKVRFTPEQEELYGKIMDIQARILRVLHGDRGIRFMMTTIMRQASSCIHGLKPFLEDILTRHFDELGLGCGDLGPEAEENGEEIIKALAVPGIREAVKEILRFAERMSDDDEKADRLVEVILDKQRMDRNKVMIFSSFRHTLAYIKDQLDRCGIRAAVIHGGVPDDERVALRDRFMLGSERDDAIDVMLFSEVGCEGLDYQFCDCLVNYDLPWNPQAIEQRIGRIDRNGQKSETVSIVNLITENTIDEEIYDRCLLRIGVFNASIGDSEEILGKVTREIYDIAEQYMLSTEERAQKEQQIADNYIRDIQEQQRLEEEKRAFFGLDLSEELMRKEMQDATNIHLGAGAIERLAAGYLDARLGSAPQCILGDGIQKTLRLSQEAKQALLADYSLLEQQIPSNPVYKAWEKHLKSTDTYLKITFDGEYATQHEDTTFIMPAHPLVRQAMKRFPEDPVQCSLRVRTDSLPAGDYPFIIYEWKYTGAKPNSELTVISPALLSSREMLSLIYDAEDADPDAVTPDILDNLEDRHYILWRQEKERYLADCGQTIRYKTESLRTSQQGQLNTLQKQLANATDERIRRMRRSQLDSLQQSFREKMQTLLDETGRCDIYSEKLVCGNLHVYK
ncbi:MAG: SNF2-related protein [Clostridia bacterium]|nr:SNF2-related protein [Clostridia bacterium]